MIRLIGSGDQAEMHLPPTPRQASRPQWSQAGRDQIDIIFPIPAGTSLGKLGPVLSGYRRLFTPRLVAPAEEAATRTVGGSILSEGSGRLQEGG